MLFKNLIYLPTIVISIIITLTIIVKDRKSNLSRAFLAIMLSVTPWVVGLYLADISSDPAIALLAVQAGLFFAAFIPVTFLIFVLTFTESKLLYRRNVLLLLLFGLALAISNTLPWSVYSVEPTKYSARITGSGFGYLLFLSIVIAFFFISFMLILKYLRHAPAMKKLQGQYILAGSIAVVVINVIFAFLFVGQDRTGIAQLLSTPSIMFFCTGVTYAIIRHNLFDIRLIVARSVGYILSLAFIGFIYGFVALFVIDEVFFDDVSMPLHIRRIVYISLAVLFGIMFEPAKRRFNKLSNRIFYRDAYDAQQFIDNLTNILVSNTDITKLLSNSAQLINLNLKPSFTEFIILDKRYKDSGAQGKIAKSLSGEQLSLLATSISESLGKLIFIDDAEHSATKTSIALLKSKNVSMVIKLVSRSELIGLVLIGVKQSGNSYTKQDKEIFQIIADELSLAVENSLSYEEIRKFNITLQEEVDDATKQLRHTNEKLKALDETKDEFISMASHQLRTPLTSVKGYVSMVLEGDAGDLNDQQKKLLTQAFISSQRMVYLISDLLNVSRLRTGKFVIEASETYLPDVIEGELAQIQETAAAKGLKLVFDKPHEFPRLTLDETKTRQVIMNFIDNAIYYTKTGGEIRVELEAKPKAVEFRVVDNGIGVPRAEQRHLFSKFYRADNARKARPDGTGLGLFMAKKVVVAQGGAIIFKSQEGKGSTFGFTFPRHNLEVTR